MPRFLPLLALASAVALAAPAPTPKINTSHLQQPSALRQKLILEYIRAHYDPAATDIFIRPRMIVIHWTAINSLTSTLAAFGPDVLSGREDIQAGGKLNTGAQFLVDRDGTIYQLSPETLFQRHTIGLNPIAVGIENVGSGNLTPEQLEANRVLVRFLVNKYPTIEYLIGHFEYGAFRGSALWAEKNRNYFTIKSDPGPAFMKSLREALAKQDIRLKSAP